MERTCVTAAHQLTDAPVPRCCVCDDGGTIRDSGAKPTRKKKKEAKEITIVLSIFFFYKLPLSV